MAEGSSKVPGWVWIAVVFVGLYFLVKQIGATASGVVKTVGQAKGSAANDYAKAGSTLLGGLSHALGDFFHGGGTATSSGTSSFGGSASAKDDELDDLGDLDFGTA